VLDFQVKKLKTGILFQNNIKKQPVLSPKLNWPVKKLGDKYSSFAHVKKNETGFVSSQHSWLQVEF